MNDRDYDAPDQDTKHDGEYRYLNGSPSDLCHLTRPDTCSSGNGQPRSFAAPPAADDLPT
jgi:hypothetical protein